MGACRTASVLFEHSAHLLKALTAAGVDYRVQIYPDSPHAVVDVLSSISAAASGRVSRAPADPASTSVRRHVLRIIRAFLLSRCRSTTVARTLPPLADDETTDS